MLLFLAGVANAQLSGSYTIDVASSTSGTNFNSWSDFASAVTSSGVSAAVTVTVKSDVTTSTRSVFGAISGSSSTNTITIDGGSKVLSYGGSYEAISFTGADYVTIKNATIRNTTTGAYAGLMRFSGASDYNKIDNCILEFSALVSATSATYYVAFSNYNTSPTSATSASNGKGNTISNCTMRTTAANSAGPYYAITCMGNTSSYSSVGDDNDIKANKIQNYYYYAVINYYTNGNQFIDNDISRSNATSSSAVSTNLYGIYSYYTYGKNRSTVYRNNNIHDLPYLNASNSSTTNYIAYWFGMYAFYNYGTTTYPFTVDKNTMKNIMVYYYGYSFYMYYDYVVDLTGNTIDNFRSYAAGYVVYPVYVNYGSDYNITGNTMMNSKFGEAGTGYCYGWYLYYIYNTNRSHNLFEDNVIKDNWSGYYFYGAQIYYYSSWKVNRNQILRNTTATNQGYFYAFYMMYYYNMEFTSNLIADNLGYYGNYNIYTYNPNSGYTTDVRQNTLHYNVPSNGYTYHFAYGYLFQDYYCNMYFVGNVGDYTSPYYVYGAYIYNTTANNIKECDHNTFYLNVPNQYWALGTSGYGSYGGWRGDVKAGPNNRYDNPAWVKTSTGDFRSNCFEMANNVPTVSNVKKDAWSVARNVVKSDRGALESVMDAEATKTDFTVPSSVCAGYQANACNIYVKNNFADTIYNFYVAYSVNGKATRQLVTAKILPGATEKVDFTLPMTLSIAGTTKIKIYLDIPDDNTKNDTLSFTTTVKPAPGGGVYAFSAKTTTPNKATYQKSRPFDVTVLNVPVIYDVVAPRVYSNSSYGTSLPNNWFASVQAYTKAGKAITGATFTAPTSTSDLEVQFQTSDATLEDSTITVVLKITDNNNGCDTNIRRNVLIYPSVTADFAYPSKICNGDDVLFINKSKVNSGSMEFFWNFGTGVAADTSNAPEPVFRFPKSGKYTVELTTKTMPYGFVFTKKYDVDVNAIPTVAFDKANACLGQDLVFTNKTNPITAKFTWDFGVAGATASTTDAKYKYSKAGTYNVSLSADLNGCIAKMTQKVYQFEKPVTKFSLTSGTCDNDKFVFTNKSTIGNGMIGSSWNFDDNGSVSTDDNATYSFSKPGKKNVKLVSMSEFGCKDSMTVVVDVRESPKAGFTNTPACSLTPTVFTNTTADVSGSVANYDWNFGDGTTSKAKSPSRSWTNLGPKTVVLKITLDNGCSSSISKELNVATQPKVNFSAADVCAGDQVIFVNNTTWPQGDINYTWDFGDNTSSINSDPSKLYNIVQTTSYNVTLYASIVGGCSDSLTQRVTVNESPRTCDFQSTPDYGYSYYGVKVEPVNGAGVSGGQNNVDYTWIFAGGGTLKSKDVNAAVNYDLQSDGEYTVTMKALVRQTGCECTKTKKVVMNRAAVKDLQEVGVAVYPNPTAGDIKVATSESFGANITVTVMTIEGKMVSTTTTANDGVMTLNTGDMSNGVYLVQVMSGNKQVTRKITVQK